MKYWCIFVRTTHSTIVLKIDDNMIYYSQHTYSIIDKALIDGMEDKRYDHVFILRMRDIARYTY